MAVSFKSNNFDFPPFSFSTVSRPVSSVPASLSFTSACSSSSDVIALSHKSLSDPANVGDRTVCSSNVYLSKPIRPSKPVCLNSVRPCNPVISKNVYLIKLFAQEILIPVDLFVQVMFVKVEVILVQVNEFV